ncbi:MAG: hypothetical protein LBI65_00955 [Candidatus Symbiothrix sp.]|jgi:hypothetical protein|nr:hypothetical protein [Candidatus Symbiothrix sp.]
MKHSSTYNPYPAAHPSPVEGCARGKRSRRRNFGFLILLACLLGEAITATAQVTIGSLEDPAKGALLDLKNQLPDNDNVTSTTGGLLLPRVKLNSLNDFSFIQSMTSAQKKNYTGFLVYNLKVNESESLEQGIYLWNGEKWGKLNKITKTENVVIKKNIYSATSPKPDKIVSVGIFEFRIATETDNKVYPQFRLKSGSASAVYYWDAIEYWDGTPNTEAVNMGDSGYDFTLLRQTVNSNTWSNCKNHMDNTERNEIWLADLKNDRLYQIQFAIIGNGSSSNVYSIIAKQY